jgi:hypothetical protein
MVKIRFNINKTSISIKKVGNGPYGDIGKIMDNISLDFF